MAGNVHNSVGGPGMAVLGGIVLVISPWLLPIGFGSKVLISLFGALLIYIGVNN